VPSFIDLAAGEDAVTRISWSLRAVNAADAAAQTSATGCLILQFFRKRKCFEESNFRPDRRNPCFTIEKEDLFKLAEETPE
jgi:hypothetical protein